MPATITSRVPIGPSQKWHDLRIRSRPLDVCARGPNTAACDFATERHLNTYILKLFVTGASPRTESAIANLQRICEEELRGQYTLEVIDVLEHPEAAENERILATPTLVKQLPPPLRRVIGDLSDKDKVLLGLEVRARNSTSK
jgi:circadian clock protein KaiB